MKKGPLSKKEKAFIDDNKSMSTEDIANKLERSVSVVSRYVEINNQKTRHTPLSYLQEKKIVA